MTYGSNLGVAALVPRYANESRRFDNVTTPTEAQVDEWRAQISAALDVALVASELPSPATHPAVVKMLDGLVNGNAAWLAESVNGQGRYQERPATTQEILTAIGNAARTFVASNALGIGALVGVPGDQGAGSGAGARIPRRVDDYSRNPAAGEYSG